MGDIFSSNHTLEVLAKSLEGLSKRHKALANNIANVDTPQYKRRDVTFQQTLKDVIHKQQSQLPLSTTHPGHISSPAPNQSQFFTHQFFDTSYRADENNVDIEKEMVEMNKNALLYDSVTNFMTSKFSLLQHAIEEGRR